MNRFSNSVGAHYTPEFLCGLSDEELAAEIREGDEWDFDLIRDLLWRADLLEAYEEIDTDAPGYEKEQWALIYKAAETLGVTID